MEYWLVRADPDFGRAGQGPFLSREEAISHTNEFIKRGITVAERDEVIGGNKIIKGQILYMAAGIPCLQERENGKCLKSEYLHNIL